jgi:hypothetical protein
MLSLRAKTAGGSHGLHMGVSNAAPWGSWLQAQDANNLATEYPLLLNPNGGNIGIGTSIPSGRLTIANPTAYAPNTITTANTYLQLGSSDYGSGGGSNNDGKFMIGFGYTGGVSNTNSPAYIGFEETSTSGATKGDLTFYTRPAASDTAPTERMRIHDSGNVSIGSQADDNGILSVAANKGSAGDLWSQVGPNNNASLIIQNLSAVDNTNAVLYFANDAGVKAAINARFINHTTDETELRFSTTGSNGTSNEDIRFTNSGMTYGNAWHEVVFGGIVTATSALTVQVDIAAKTTGQIFKVEAIFNHWNSDNANYTVTKKVKYYWAYSTATAIVEHNDGTADRGGSSVGTWTVDKPSNTRLRVTKSAGANSWPGEWYVRITSSCPITKV